MIETIITIYETLTTAQDAYKRLSNLIYGNKQEQYLQQIATDMKDMKVHIERLSDTILYAVNLDGIDTLDTQKPQYFNDLREIRQLLEPLQKVQKEPLLSSAMIEAPRPMRSKNPRHVLQDISPLEYITIPVVDHPWEPMLFQENGIYYVGWQTPAYLSKLGCQYPSHWALNDNVLPQNQLAESHPLVLNPNKPKPDEPKSPKKRKLGNSKGSIKPNPSAKQGRIFRDRLKDGGEGPKMIIIPAGTFRMGDIQGTGGADEKPVHQVSVKSFAMGRYPITFAEYDLFCEAAVNRKKPSDDGWGRDNRPVINVSWEAAVAYFKWLTKQTGKPYRLPSEAEWEYASRAGTDTDYWWGNEIGQNRANCNKSGSQWSNKQTSPVGSFDPNSFGLYDTVGNVWEWCADPWHDNYEKAPTDGSILEKQGKNARLLRGGSFINDPDLCRAAYRGRNSSDFHDWGRGFRGCADLAL
jgi:formylglycine-generating enzyme required for sulfatase activity